LIYVDFNIEGQALIILPRQVDFTKYSMAVGRLGKSMTYIIGSHHPIAIVSSSGSRTSLFSADIYVQFETYDAFAGRFRQWL